MATKESTRTFQSLDVFVNVSLILVSSSWKFEREKRAFENKCFKDVTIKCVMDLG